MSLFFSYFFWEINYIIIIINNVKMAGIIELQFANKPKLIMNKQVNLICLSLFFIIFFTELVVKYNNVNMSCH